MAARIINRVIHSPFPENDVKDSSAPELIEKRLKKFSDKIIIVDAYQSLTACELLKRIRKYAVGFQYHGVKAGSMVCAHIGSTVENAAAALGVVFAGGTLVMAKTAYVARELMFTMEDSKCTFLLTDQQSASNVRKLSMPSRIKSMFAVGSEPGFVNVTQFQELSDETFKPHVPTDSEKEVVVVLYTSGSTGLPKGVEISHRGYCASFHAFRALEICNEDDAYLAWNPLTHVSGFALGLFCMFMGAKIVIAEPLISCKDFLKALKTFQVIDLTNGDLLDPYQNGEILVHTPCVMKGYLGHPEATAEALSEDGWLRTDQAAVYKHLYGGIIFMKRLPKSESGKILRQELKAKMAREYEKLKEIDVPSGSNES